MAECRSISVASEAGRATKSGVHATREGVGIAPTRVPLMIPLVPATSTAFFVATQGGMEAFRPLAGVGEGFSQVSCRPSGGWSTPS